MRTRARLMAIVSFAVLVIDFFTLENRVVTTNAVAQGIGRSVGLLALVVLACSTVLLIVGRLRRPGSGRDVRGAHSPAAMGPEHYAGAPSVPGIPREQGGLPGAAGKVRVIRTRLRSVKVVIGLLVLASWFIAMPLYVYRTRIAKAPDFRPGPWVADAFLSVFAVAVQYAAPTPVALAFWPSAVMGTYLVFSRKDRPVLDALSAVVAVGLACALWYILILRIDPGGR